MAPSIEIDFLSPFAAFFQFGLKRATRPVATELTALGFVRVGIQRERSSEGHQTRALAFCSEQFRTWGSVFISRGAPCLYLFTAFEGGQIVLTARYPRPTVKTERAILSGHPELGAGKLLQAHLGYVAQMEANAAALPTAPTVAARLDAAYRYYGNLDANRTGIVVRKAA